MLRGIEVPQELVAITEIVPPLVPAVVRMLLVVELPVHPVGIVQVYVVPATFVTLYVAWSPGQKVGLPEIALGCGAPTST